MPTTDYEAATNPAVIPQRDLARYTLIARFPDPTSARRAVERLRTQGMTPNDVTLLGSEGDIVRPASAMTEPDRRVLRSTASGTWWGMVAGALIGAVAGIVVLAIPPINSAIGHVSAGGYLVAALVGAIIGLTLGGLVLGIAYLDRSKAGIDSYGAQVSRGETLVGARATGERARVLAEALRQSGAVDVRDELPPAMRRAV